MSIDFPLSVLLDEIQSTMLARHSKYGPRNISDSPGGPLNGIRTRLFDKLARINHAIDTGVEAADFSDDSFRDCLVDVVGYGLIGLLVVDGDWPGVAVEKPLESLIERVLTEKLTVAPYARPRTRRYSSLPDALPGSADNWPAGTTFQADDGAWIWTRYEDYWRASYTFDTFATLAELVAHRGYTDGTITTPDIPSSRKDAA